MTVRMRSNLPAVKAALAENGKRGLTAGAVTIHGEARKRTPVDTGRLRASLAWTVGPAPKVHTATENGSEGPVTVSYELRAEPSTAVVGTNLAYAVHVHEDLRNKVPRKGGVGQSKFLEAGARAARSTVERLMRMALKGQL